MPTINDPLGNGSNSNLVGNANQNDIMFGLGGDDTLVPLTNEPGSTITETADGGEGFDTLKVDATGETEKLTAGVSVTGYFASTPSKHIGINAYNIERVDITGGGNDDSITGLNNNDVLRGGGGNDTLDGSYGFDSFDGGAGFDTVDMRFWNGNINVDLIYEDANHGRTYFEDNTGPNDYETLAFIENIKAGNGDDKLRGNASTNKLEGGGGNDHFYVTFGSDTIDGGAGIDTLNFLQLNPATTGAITVSLALGFASYQNIPDVLTIDSIEIVATGSSNDILVGDSHSNALAANDGVDTLSGGGGDDVLFGGEGNDLVFGGEGNDDLEGNEDNDRVLGQGGNDDLHGNEGNDILVGGTGKDDLTGGDDRDTFDFNDKVDSRVGATKHDVIVDFDRTERDKIDLKNIDANTHHAGNDQFAFFIGKANFHGREGELRYRGGLLQGDVDGDGKADFEIYLYGAPKLMKLDIIL